MIQANGHMYEKCTNCEKLVKITGWLNGLHFCEMSAEENMRLELEYAAGDRLDEIANRMNLRRKTAVRRFMWNYRESDRVFRKRAQTEFERLLTAGAKVEYKE